MKRPGFYIVLILLLGFAQSCRKQKYPESVVENVAVYKFEAKVGNVPVSLNAGVDGYYMFSSYKLDTNNVYNFNADLRKAECNGSCGNSLKIQINDYKVSLPNAAANIDSSLFPRTYLMLSGVNDYIVTFQSQFNKQAFSYLWDFGDGGTSTIATPQHTYNKSGNYNVSLKIRTAQGCESTIRNTQTIGGDTNALSAVIGAYNIGSTNAGFIPVVKGGKQPYRYAWSFGDGTAAATSTVNHTYAVAGAYPVSLRVTDASNAVVTANYNLVLAGDVSSCNTNYKVSTIHQAITSQVANILSRIIVSWTDANGVVYTSNDERQPSTSHFEVLSVENGSPNENNEPTKRLRLKFNCHVYNGNKSLAIEDAETTICVAYK